jgi:hypothetical protein
VSDTREKQFDLQQHQCQIPQASSTNLDHVLLGDALSDAHNQWDLSFDRLLQKIGCNVIGVCLSLAAHQSHCKAVSNSAIRGN